MPTIKTQLISGQRRIITKLGGEQRRVSCSCCCCARISEINNTFGLISIFGLRGSPTRKWQDQIFDGQDYFYENIEFSLLEYYNFVGDPEANKPTNPPDPVGFPTWKRHKGCLRFLCRCVKVENSVIISQQNVQYGSTTTGKNIWEDIAKPAFGDETSSGTYLYIVNFAGWRFRRISLTTTPPLDQYFFRPDDSYYHIAKYEIIENT